MGADEREQNIPTGTGWNMVSSDKWGDQKAGKGRETDEGRANPEEEAKVWEGWKQETDSYGGGDTKEPNQKLSELAEVEQNLSREENRRQGKKLERLPSTIVPEGRKEIQPNPDMDGQTGDATAIKERLVEEHWVRLLSSKNHIWNKEDWMSTSRLENSSLEEQRKKAYGQDQPRIFDRKEEKEIEL